jgi:hypothetical protein
MPIFPAPDNHNAFFWYCCITSNKKWRALTLVPPCREACEADYCNAHVGKGGDYVGWPQAAEIDGLHL